MADLWKDETLLLSDATTVVQSPESLFSDDGPRPRFLVKKRREDSRTL